MDCLKRKEGSYELSVDATGGMANAFFSTEFFGNASFPRACLPISLKALTHGYPASLYPSSRAGLFKKVKEYAIGDGLLPILLDSSLQKPMHLVAVAKMLRACPCLSTQRLSSFTSALVMRGSAGCHCCLFLSPVVDAGEEAELRVCRDAKYG